MWDDGSGAPGRRRADRDDRDAAGHPVVEYDIPTTFLPVQGQEMVRPRRPRRRRRPVLTVALVTVATVSLGSGAGLLMARALDQGGNDPAAVAAASTTATPSAPSSTAPAGSRTAVSAAPVARPTDSGTKVSRSDPSRSAAASTPAKTSAAPKPKADPSSSKAPTGDAVLEAQVLTLVNQQRAKAGCRPLTSNARLVLAARRHSQFMADSGKHAHEGIGDGTPQDRIEKAGYTWRGWGENIAWGYTSAASVMDGWMGSAGHRANILNCSFTEIGVGVDDAGTNWTQDFGIPG